MDFRSLRAFVEVVRSGSFSEAAKTICVTQSAISKIVRQLEEEVGIPLLDRIGYRIALTSAGEVVYSRALKLLADRDDLLSELGDIRGMRRGTLRLGLAPVASALLFAPLFAAYRQRYPGIEIQLVEQGSTELEDGLREGRIDFAGALLPTSTEFDWVEVRREPLVALLPDTHRLASAQAISLKELKDTPFISYDRSFALYRIVQNACRASGFEPNIVAQSSQTDFMIELVRAGLGVAIVPRVVTTRLPEAMSSVALDEPDCRWVMTMAWRRDGYLSRAASAWLDLVREFHA